MENKPQNIFERLDNIEASQSVTQTQNEQILDLLSKISSQQAVKQSVSATSQPQTKLSDQEEIINFIRKSKKRHVWFGPIEEFKRSKKIANVLFVTLIIVGVLSTILTSSASEIYTTFSVFENIWLIFACILFSYSVNAKKKMLDTDLKKHSDTVFVQDADGTWRDTNKEKKRFRWSRRISYIAVVLNIIAILAEYKGAISITAIIFELAFAGITIGLNYAYTNLFCMYGNFILYTGKNASNTKTVTLIFDVIGNKLAPYSEYKKNMKEYL